ncbi:MAG: 6-phosphogluconolactonase [Gemmatimonadota bacterium]
MNRSRVQPDIEVLPESEALTARAAELFIAAATAAIASTGRFVVALSGGLTPKKLYALLATEAFAARIEWALVHVFWGDERWVPPSDPASNFRMTRETLLDHVPIPPENIHRMEGDSATDAAARCERVLRDIFATAEGPPHHSAGARFDLVLLGLGEDGHTASWFPGRAAVGERQRWAVAEYIREADMWRVTLTPVIINAAAQIIFLVSGAAKAETLSRVLEGPDQPDQLPAQAVKPTTGTTRWLTDSAAAELLRKG